MGVRPRHSRPHTGGQRVVTGSKSFPRSAGRGGRPTRCGRAKTAVGGYPRLCHRGAGDCGRLVFTAAAPLADRGEAPYVCTLDQSHNMTAISPKSTGGLRLDALPTEQCDKGSGCRDEIDRNGMDCERRWDANCGHKGDRAQVRDRVEKVERSDERIQPWTKIRKREKVQD